LTAFLSIIHQHFAFAHITSIFRNLSSKKTGRF
jgi:hypothetical protein